MNRVLFSHESDHWATPKKIMDQFSHCFDPCPLHADFDGLAIAWAKNNFVNPPYSNIGPFVSKAIEEAKLGNTTYLLVPARTDTKWFHRILRETNYSIHFYEGRLRFNESKNSAPFPSILITIKP